LGTELSVDASAEDIAQFQILGCAIEDCYYLCEFQVNMERAYEGVADPNERRVAIRTAFVTLLGRGEILVHRGQQCTGNDRSGRNLPVAVDEIPDVSDEEWGMFCVCDTDLTKDAYGRAYQKTHEVGA
jgi:hypothetical protein